MLATFADLHRQEVAAEEDVYRTLPFFGTALGVVLAALVYAAGHLPKLAALPMSGLRTFAAAAVLIGLAFVEAGFVVVFLSRAVALRPYQRIGPEPALHARLNELQIYYDAIGAAMDLRDRVLLQDMRMSLLESYARVTPGNRLLNGRRYRLRARAASHLLRSLIWALAASAVIIAGNEFGLLPS